MSGTIPNFLFEHEMRTTSRVLGRESGLEVVLDGENAAAVRGRVVLPKLDKSKPITVEAANIARGFVDHEAAHNRFSTLDVLDDARHDEAKSALVNGLEDVRIERLYAEEYSGARVNLAATANAVMRRVTKQVKSGDIKLDNPKDILPMAIAMAGRKMDGYHMPAFEDWRKLVQDDVWEEAERLAGEVASAGSTKDVLDIVVKHYGKLDEKPEDEEEERRKMPHGPGNKSGIGTSGGWKPPPMGPIEAGVLEDALPTFEGAHTGYYSRMDLDHIWENFDDYLAKGSAGLAGLWGTSPDEVKKRGLERYLRTQKNLGPAIRATRMSLERSLIVAKQRDWQGGLMQGHLDPRRLASVLTGSLDFRRKRSETLLVETAVTLLIDMSGSMSGGSPKKSKVAMETAIVLAEALDKVGIPMEIAGFTSDRTHVSEDGRHGAIEYPIYKRFHDSFRQAAKHLGLIEYLTQYSGAGQNADGDSVLHAWLRLRERSEERKVLVVLSDGYPSASSGCDEEKRLKDVVKSILKDGGEPIGIGICSDAVSRYYPDFVVVNSAEKLATEASLMLRRILLPESVVAKPKRKVA